MRLVHQRRCAVNAQIMKKTSFRKVPVRGMTAEEVLALWQEGRLFYEREDQEETEEVALERCQREALSYVDAIHAFVSPGWLPHIDQLWHAILGDEQFSCMLLMRKGRMRGRMNRYVVTNIVFHLKALDIYQCDSQLVLHRTLEGICGKNSIYKSARAYALSRAQRQKIRELKISFDGLK